MLVPALCCLLVACATVAAVRDRAWTQSSLPPSDRARALLAQMTLDEKLAMLFGHPTTEYVGGVPANARLGIPALRYNDGPQGFRARSHRNLEGTSTAFPSALAMAASWDVQAVRRYGQAMGKEFFDKGANVQLGPGVCLARVPVNGRNFEYLSGEDPFLGKSLVGPLVQGIQSQNVIANVKHFVDNNQETDRGTISVVVDSRTQFEMCVVEFCHAPSVSHALVFL